MKRWLIGVAILGAVLFLGSASVLAVLAYRTQALRETLYRLIQPVPLSNCTFERFGERNDGGYLVCANLLNVQAGYSYGISGYDGFGCGVSRRVNIPIHEYDCFDLRAPACPGGNLIFHAECVGAVHGRVDGRPWNRVDFQIAANGDTHKALIVKMDVEGSEWDALPVTSDATLATIDQLVIELHGATDPRFVPVLERLAEHFYVAHVHFNNWACSPDVHPFPSEVYEVLYVNKRIGRLSPGVAQPRATTHPLDAPNRPGWPDCQFPAAPTWRDRARDLLKPLPRLQRFVAAKSTNRSVWAGSRG
jgi:hypothetical protein